MTFQTLTAIGGPIGFIGKVSGRWLLPQQQQHLLSYEARRTLAWSSMPCRDMAIWEKRDAHLTYWPATPLVSNTTCNGVWDTISEFMNYNSLWSSLHCHDFHENINIHLYGKRNLKIVNRNTTKLKMLNLGQSSVFIVY